ncbi:hypothetical protein DFJ67_1788 [Asanoa ferruginea]|uniref:Uncharacterized protein n=1 Tax=Asanoa ferruginea TaxID=53367 RepID=A0A3D9ZEI5_9ACTN|nr:hypothetical protein [Asanoa ferruginea]REF95826.1 hypothetical protein DFJ67_1788 [Asanoa ferruginea]GIF53762.1 hypothetical protein Afe04nite_83010 [Asanoa ferruginea]
MSYPTSPARPRSSAARICTIIAFVFAVGAVLLFPLPFGLLGLILGIVAAMLGDKPLGWYAAGASVVGAVLGIIIGAALAN